MRYFRNFLRCQKENCFASTLQIPVFREKKRCTFSEYTALCFSVGLQLRRSPYGLISHAPGEFCGMALYPILSLSVQPAASTVITTADSRIKDAIRILFRETLDQSVEEIVVVHFNNVEGKSRRQKEAAYRHDDHKIFGFQHVLHPPSVCRLPIDLVADFDILASGRNVGGRAVSSDFVNFDSGDEFCTLFE